MDYSFIIPVYNCEEYIEKCVENIMKIKSVSYEVLLIDDGSYDASGKLCDAIAEKYSFVKCIHKENGGVSSARNRGIEEAAGKYIVFVDADDTLETDKFDKILEKYNGINADSLFYGMSFDYYHNGVCYRNEALYYQISGIMDDKHWAEDFYRLYIANALSPVWNKIFNRDIIKHNNIRFNTDMFLYEDLEFSLRYMACCGDIYNIPDVIYRYRQSEDEGNARRRIKKIKSLSGFLVNIESAVDLLKENLKKKNIELNGYRQMLLNLYIGLLREKISVSSISEIREYCEEFYRWYMSKGYVVSDERFSGNKQFIEMALNAKAKKLWISNKKTFIRHKVANFIKYSGIYRHLKGRNK